MVIIPNSYEYFDADGNRVSLDQLCRLEPSWAADRIRHMQAAIERMDEGFRKLLQATYDYYYNRKLWGSPMHRHDYASSKTYKAAKKYGEKFPTNNLMKHIQDLRGEEE